MNCACYRFKLDITKTNAQVSLPIKKGDTGRKLVVSLTERSKPYMIADGCYAVFAGEQPDGNPLLNDCVIADNTIVYTITPQTVAAVGNVHCEIKLYDKDGLLITSPTFVLLVDAPVYYGGKIPESAPEYQAIQKIVDENLVRTLGIINLYVCSEGEHIAEPDENTAYLIPQDNEGVSYGCWVYANDAWEYVDTLTVTLDETDGGKGGDGLSAYEIAVKNGFEGTEQEWLESLGGTGGKDTAIPKPIFIISSDGGWIHQHDGTFVTVEEMVDAYFGAGIFEYINNGKTINLSPRTAYFAISTNGVIYSNWRIHDSTEEQFLAAVSKYVPEEIL